jgi:ATP-binding cassette subfamily B protein
MFEKLKNIWALMRGQRLMYVLAVVALVVSAALMYLPPLIRMWAIDYLIDNNPIQGPWAPYLLAVVKALGGTSVLAQNLWIAGAVMIVATCLSGLFMYLKGRWTAVAAEAVAKSVRERLYDHLQHLPARYHDKADTGDLVQRCSSDVETVRSFLADSAVEAGRGIIQLSVGLPVMIWVNPTMAVASVVLMPVIVGFSVVFFMLVRHKFRLSDEAEGAMTTVLEENLTGIRVVLAFGRGDYENRKFAACNAEYRRRWSGVIRLFAVFWSSSDGMCMMQIAIVTVTGAYLLAVGGGEAGGLTVGGFIAFLTFVHLFMWPVRQLGRLLADFGKATVSMDRIFEILRQQREDNCQADPAEAPRLSGDLSVEHLSFSHDQTAVLRDISFRVRQGETLALLGPSGSGKSTLVNLLLRLYDYDRGSIFLDGKELREVDRKHARAQFGAVLQEPFLYSKSVRDNIRLGAHRADDRRVAEAAKMACVDDTIRQFDKGYDTLVGERGVTLSGGQRQRVALARAVLSDPPVLILDDALSAVDTRTEAIILDALRNRRGKRTTLLIAHRLSTLMQADRILVLDGGRIVQDGTHERLIGVDGLYRRLWNIQSSLEEDLRAEAGGNGNGSGGAGNGGVGSDSDGASSGPPWPPGLEGPKP